MFGKKCRYLSSVASLSLVPWLWVHGQNQSGNLVSQSALAPPLSAGRRPEPIFQRRFPVLPGSPVQTVPASVVTLAQMVRAAGTIFSGRVLSIARESASPSAPIETVAVSFQVERALRGADTGKKLTMREWAGAWAGGQRYRAGERVLLFLYPPSKLGLTSCVAGPIGRFTVDSLGRIVLSDEHLAVFRGDFGGRARISLDEFAQAVQHAGGGERVQP